MPGMLDLAMGPKLMVCHDLKVKRREGRRRERVREREREAMCCTGGSLYTILPTGCSLTTNGIRMQLLHITSDIPSSLHHGNRATTAMTVSPRVCGAPSRCPTQSRRGNVSTRSCTSKSRYNIQCVARNMYTEK